MYWHTIAHFTLKWCVDCKTSESQCCHTVNKTNQAMDEEQHTNAHNK